MPGGDQPPEATRAAQAARESQAAAPVAAPPTRPGLLGVPVHNAREPPVSRRDRDATPWPGKQPKTGAAGKGPGAKLGSVRPYGRKVNAAGRGIGEPPDPKGKTRKPR